MPRLLARGDLRVHKLAGLAPYTWNRLSKAIKQEKDLNEVMIDLGRHFRVDPDDADDLFRLKRKQHPRTKVLVIDESNKSFTPSYLPEHDTIITYKEPWSFLHEYGHAFERADNWDYVRRMLPVKHRLPKKTQDLLDEYINEAYMSGDIKSQQVGEFLNKAIQDSKRRVEGDAWRLTEELRANARAYKDSKTLIDKTTADKIMQPLSVSDVSYIGEFYPEELGKLLGIRNNRPISEKIRDINILKILKDKIDMALIGLPA